MSSMSEAVDIDKTWATPNMRESMVAKIEQLVKENIGNKNSKAHASEVEDAVYSESESTTDYTYYSNMAINLLKNKDFPPKPTKIKSVCACGRSQSQKTPTQSQSDLETQLPDSTTSD